MAEDWDSLDGTAHQFLQPTYEMVRVLLEDIIQRPALDDLDSKVNLVDVNFAEDWQGFAEHYHGYLACVAFSVTLLLVFIIGGVIFCCCRCCPCCSKCSCCSCCCSDKSSSSKKQRSDKLSTGQLCCVLLFLILIGFMAMGIVIMFVSNPLLDEEVKDRTVYQRLDKTVNDLQDFVDHTMAEMTNTTLDMYLNIQDRILKALNLIPAASMAAIEKVTGVQGALRKQREFFETIRDCSNQIDDTRDDLEDDAFYLEQELDILRINITTLFPDCIITPPCNESLEALTVAVDYTSLNNFSDTSQAASQAEKSVQKTENEVNNIEVDIQNQLQSGIDDVGHALDAGYDGLSTFMYNTTDDVDLGLVEKVEEFEDNEIREAFEDYWDVWFYCMIGLSVVLTLIALLYLLGLSCGICGKKPREGGTCNASKAPCLLMTSVYLLLFFSILVIVVSLVLFVLGGILHTEACRYFEEPVEYEPSLDIIDKIIVTHTDISVNITHAINACGDGSTLYEALKLDERDDLDLNETLNPESYGITEALENLSDVEVTIGDVSLVAPATLLYTATVNQTLRNKDYEMYIGVMTSNITRGNLSHVADTLEQYANSSSNETEFRRCLQRMRDLDNHVRGMEDKHVVILGELHRLQNSTGEDPMDDQLLELQEAEDQLSAEGDNLVKDVLVVITSTAVETIYDGVANISHSIRYEIGECGPLHNTAYGFLSYVCVDILYPLNAFWFGMGWFLTFSIISMFTACKLASIFRADEVAAAGTYYKSRSKRASAYAPSDDVYITSAMTLNLPDASFQPRDQPSSPVLVSYVGKTSSALYNPYSGKETNVDDYNNANEESNVDTYNSTNHSDCKPFYC